MKKILAFLLTLAMVLSLAACGEKDHPNAGVYNAVSCTALGLSLDCAGDWMELKGNGKGKVCLMGEEYNCSWTLEGENFTMKNHGDEFSGTLHNGIITLDYGDMVYIYIMDRIEDEEGNVRGHVHVWTEADCETAKTCSDCGAVEGEALGHDATEANYQDPSVCKRCGVTLAEKLQADMEKYGITEFMEVGVIYPYSTATYEDDGEHETTGELQILSYEVFKSAEGYPEKEGYMWHVVQVQADFFDQNARNWGMSVGLCYEDYYNIELSDDTDTYNEETKFSSRMINFHGEEMPIFTQDVGSWSGWKVMDGRYQDRYSLTRAWLVPEGYDGSVVGFYNIYAVSWDDRHIYEVYDSSQFWLFRLS